jgi:class 3 adenylate cyclase/ABC-type phosphate transport system substrate-binding protein
MMGYVPQGSGVGIENAENGQHMIATTDALLSSEERTQYPNLKTTPAIGFAVSVVYSLPNVDQLLLPRCVVVDLFKGIITHWNDPQIQAANPALVIPGLPVKVTVRGSKSGTTEVFTAGLRKLDEACNGEAADIEITGTWALPAAIVTNDTSALLAAVQSTDGAIGYVSAPSARAQLLQEVTFLDETTGGLTTTETGFVQAAIDAGSMDTETGELTFPLAANAYPLVGVTYFVIDVDRTTGSCELAKSALEWTRFALASEEGRALTIQANFVPIGVEGVSRAVQLIESTKCDGTPLYPTPAATSETAAESTNLTLIGSVTGVAVLAVALIAVQVVRSLFFRGSRDLKCAPKDDSNPFTVAFTDIQASTRLWAAAPHAMGPALDQHHSIMRQLIAKHQGFEVKTIGDSFMVAFMEARNAAEFALDIQSAFMDAKWASVIDEVYREQLTEMTLKKDERSHRLRVRNSNKDLYAQDWNGIRVRVGVHTATGEIRYDSVTQSYDYYGTVVNTAARIESVAHGGQILISEEAFLSAYPEGAPKNVNTVDLGPQELRGLSAPVLLTELTASRFQGRLFPRLRLEKAAEVSDGHQSEFTTTTNASEKSGDSSSHGGAGTSDAVDRLASAMTNAPGARVGKGELMLTFTFVTTLLAPLKKQDRKNVIALIRKAWRAEEDGAHRPLIQIAGPDRYALLITSLRACHTIALTSNTRDMVPISLSERRISGTSNSTAGRSYRVPRSADDGTPPVSPRHEQTPSEHDDSDHATQYPGSTTQP